MALRFLEHLAPNRFNTKPIKDLEPMSVELKHWYTYSAWSEESSFHMLWITDSRNNQVELWYLLLKVTRAVVSIVSIDVKEDEREKYPKHFAQVLAGVLRKIQSILPQVSEVRIHESTGPNGVKKKVVDALQQSWVINTWTHRKIADDWTVLPRTSTGSWYLTLPERSIQ